MSIDTATAAKVAKLARIRVEEDDLPALANEFNTILGFIDQLNRLESVRLHQNFGKSLQAALISGPQQVVNLIDRDAVDRETHHLLQQRLTVPHGTSSASS